MFVAAFLYPIYCMLNGRMDTSKWILPFVISVPFDTSQFYGWYLLWFIQLNMSIAYTCVMLSITSYFVSCSVYICAICDHFDLIFKSLKKDDDECAVEKKGQSQCRSTKYRNKIKRAINVHVQIYEYVPFIHKVLHFQ